MTTPAAAPVANPTWYGNIRNLFTPTDVSHMRGIGIDLASYDVVKLHAGNIYQQTAAGNMPPHNPWPADWVAMFLTWMNNDYPKGVPVAAPNGAAALATLAAKVPTRIRKEVTTLTGPELDLLKKAFSGILALPITDPNSYFVQAAYHWLPAPNAYCMHHVAGYNPWHRAYMLSFENALRSVPGCESVTLPYWDITTPFPEVLKSPPFASYTFPEDVGPAPYVKGYVTSRFDYATIEDNLRKNNVAADIYRAMSKTDWEDFHGLIAGAPNNTIIAAHDQGHDSIGPTMSDQDVAAYDPVFWFFHSNWDRLFWKWQRQMQATDLNGLITTISKQTDPVSYQVFTDPALEVLNPFTTNPPKVTTVSIIDSVNSLDVGYQDPVGAPQAHFAAKTKIGAAASEKFFVHTQLANVRVAGVNRLKIPGSFRVHLTKDGQVLATRAFFQPTEVEKCATCVENAIVHFDFELPLETLAGGKLGVWVEPVKKAFIGDRFPHKLMGSPTVEVRLLLSNE
jgi:tyrosinase